MCRLNACIEADVSDNLGIPDVPSSHRNLNKMKDGSNISDSSVSHDKIIDADITVEENLNHQTSISQDENVENGVPSLTKTQHSAKSLTCKIEDGSNVSDSSVSHDKIIDADSNVEENLNHQITISQDENDLPSLSKIQHSASSTSLTWNALYYKVLVIFGVCCIIGLYLIPTISYYVSKTIETVLEQILSSHMRRTLQLQR